MTRKQIEVLIKLHTARLNRAIAILNEQYQEFEEDENQANYDFWIGEFRRENQIIEWLRQQTPDDE